MRSTLWFTVASLVRLAAGQYTVPPPTSAPPDTIQDCTNWYVGADGDTCAGISDDNFITLDQLYRYNPSLKDGCNVQAGTSYCVEENWGIPVPPTTTDPATTTEPTATGIVTPLPTQPPGIVDGCTKFHFVKSGTSCSSILTQYGITIAQLYAWNSGVGPECTGLQIDVYVCVAGPEVPTPTPTEITTAPNPTTTGANGIVTPSPTQPPSITPDCNKFYFVNQGTSCSTVLSENGITLAQLFEWNSGVNDDCSGMWAKVYLCVGVIGGGEPTPTSTDPIPTTTAGNGIPTPSPTQEGMIDSCDKFHFVESPQTCSTVLAQYGLSLPQFYAWNSGVKDDCSGMWLNVYVCVHATTGVIPTTTLWTSTTTTSAGNGVATPTPIQPGMVTNCNKFYQVGSGDTCDVISAKTGVSKQNILAWNKELGAACNVWLGYYICIGLL